MYLNLQAKVKVGNATFENISSLEITESVIELSDKAKVVIPRNYKSLAGNPVLDVIKVGDKASIYLGYNGNLSLEFEGYIREIESDTPLILHLDDEMYLLKMTNYLESWEKISLKEILKTIAPGYSIQCPDLSLNKFSINNNSAYQVLMHLKQQYGLYSYLKEKTLHCGFAYDIKDKAIKEHTYEFKKNIKKNDLKYKRKEDYKIKIIAIANRPDGKKSKLEIGSKENNASCRTLNFGNIEDSELKKLANAELNKLCFDGYTGSITGFGVPRTKAGDTLKIIDKEEPERAGKYLIEGVKIRYGKTYFERINKLSYKV